ncbi:MAG TPA: DUF3037 domain-containing protein, partial [Candidatus Sulfotelmatobacter sp.]|nr:DUF3037 domain-containing protein [Candidatus Sulfotelmatobacter sp.]
MAPKQQCRFFVLRYAPDAVKNEFVNIGLVLLPPAGAAEVRFTHDWSRVRCLDPWADIEVLEAIEADLRAKLREMNGDHDFILRRIQDSFSNALQPSEFQGCLAESPAAEADELARLYLDRPRRRQSRELSTRQTIYQKMRSEFESAGVWPLMWDKVPVSRYTRSGDPLKIDCGYSPNGTVKLFHAVSLTTNVDVAKVLAFTFPQLKEGIRKAENKQTHLTAIVEDDLPAENETIDFARQTLEQQSIQIASASEMP